jgi:hypothetical protein
MLLTENIFNLLPTDVKNEISEYVDIKHLQYGVEVSLGLGASYLIYSSGIQGWGQPSARAVIFCAKDTVINAIAGTILNADIESVTEIFDEHGYIGEKEESLILETLFGISIGMISPAPIMTAGVMTLGAVRNYFDIEEQNIYKIIGGSVGFVKAYFAKSTTTYYQYTATTIGAAYAADILGVVYDLSDRLVPQLYDLAAHSVLEWWEGDIEHFQQDVCFEDMH